jgi:hypothetical protein
MKKVVPIIIIVLLVAFGAYFAWTQISVNDESRAGILVKFGQKGVVFKTYEGEINQIGMGQDSKVGLVNNLWDFSVKDQSVADALEKVVGKNVKLHYKQINSSFFWQGKTNYFVDKVDVVNE